MQHTPRDHDEPGPLSASDPPPDAAGRRPGTLIIVAIALLVTAMVVLHLAGVLGPGAH
jgi:hypothetical protein